jgi:mannose-6-phosphate isomerase-like protein (cupin superfamily)
VVIVRDDERRQRRQEDPVTSTETRPALKTFDLAGDPLLAEGSSMRLLAETPEFWMHLKIYSTGGENGLHAHVDEDHAFVVLQGQATYVDGDGAEHVVNPYEGVLVPKGALYRFQSSGDENLVLLRVGTSQKGIESVANRTGADGEPRPAHAPENITGAVDPVPVAGQFFGPK